MAGFLGSAHLWVKAAHIIFIIFWMAGLFILGRYLVHITSENNDVSRTLWAPRLKMLRSIILTPALIIAWVTGLSLAFNLGFQGGWLHVKLLLVLLLSGYHGWMVAQSRKMLMAGANPLSTKQLRLLNEVPALFTIAVVILAVVRPF